VSRTPVWVDKQALLLLHEESLALFGGERGLRDETLLDAALARPVRRFNDDQTAAPSTLAADYGYGLARDHPFVDGNKRTALLGIGLFLACNGHPLKAGQIDAIRTMLALAAGDVDEAALARWIKANAG
jgi:death on curing protein